MLESGPTEHPDRSKLQTQGKSLEEINAAFGDEVVVHFADATGTPRDELTAKVRSIGRAKEAQGLYAHAAFAGVEPEGRGRAQKSKIGQCWCHDLPNDDGLISPRSHPTIPGRPYMLPEDEAVQGHQGHQAQPNVPQICRG